MSTDTAILAKSTAGIKSQWAWHLGALAALLALILAAFPFEVAQAAEVWWIYPTYSHCFLILPISAWLIWEKRHELAQATPSLAPWALLAVPPLLILWLAGKVATINEVRQFVVVALMQVAMLTLLGWHLYRAILFPALYLFFLVPFGQYLIPPLQAFATRFTDIGLTLFGVPHFTEGTLIELANGRYEIAEACAGLRFLIATIALGVLFTHIVYSKWYKIGGFLVASVVVPLIGNGFRCLAIIMLAHYTNNQVAVGADHLVYGWFFNMLILGVLFFLGLRFRDPQSRAYAAPQDRPRETSRASLLLVAAAGAVAVSAGPAFAYWHENRPITANVAAVSRPLQIDGWSSATSNGRWQPTFPGVDQEFLASFASGLQTVDVAIEFYGRNREGRSLVSAVNKPWDAERWHQVADGSADGRLGNQAVRFKEAVIITGRERRLVWSTYWMDGRFTTSSVMIKLTQLKTLLTGNEAAAMIAFSTTIDSSIEEARVRLTQVGTSSTDLLDRLTDTSRPQQPRISAD